MNRQEKRKGTMIGKVLDWMRHTVNTMQVARNRSRSLRELGELSDYMLQDIGLSREGLSSISGSGRPLRGRLAGHLKSAWEHRINAHHCSVCRCAGK